MNILDPAGPGARHVATLWWPMLWISTGVFVVVVAMLVRAVLRGRRTNDDLDKRTIGWGEPFIAIAGVLVPVLILGGVYLFSLGQMNALSTVGAEAKMKIDVIGHDWWWEVRYPNGAITANEIHIPVGEVVRLNLTTADVIHSFWVPELQVKQDQIPGHDNSLWISADEPGRYRGQCAEFCGLQHANMVVTVVAEDRDAYDTWVAAEARPASTVASDGADIFMSSSCAGCHAIRGTEATGQLGPDLTHVASRTTIAGVLDNTPTNLARFVADPQTVKPGVTMPPTELSPEEVDAVVQYLESLR
ncbi:MAG TPA: cytochrome c oxidase subunit II [Actinomycetota bacterium]|nr:cytochrome c oxidase subunit II [Actinomycetota bacterium]